MKSTAKLILAMMILSIANFAAGQEGDTAPATETPTAPFTELNTKGKYSGKFPLADQQQILSISDAALNKLFKPDPKKDSSSVTLKPKKIYLGKRKGRAIFKCNMSWEKKKELTDSEKADYQSGAIKSTILSINAPIDTPNKTSGIPEPKGKIRDLTATFNVKIDKDYFDGHFTCKVHDLQYKGKLELMTTAEILKALKEMGFQK